MEQPVVPLKVQEIYPEMPAFASKKPRNFLLPLTLIGMALALAWRDCHPDFIPDNCGGDPSQGSFRRSLFYYHSRRHFLLPGPVVHIILANYTKIQRRNISGN